MFPFTKVIVVCWIVFWAYWLVSSFGTKRNSYSSVKQFAGVRIAFFVLAVILFRFLNVQNFSSINQQVTHKEWLLTIGFIIFLIGLALAIWARLNLGKNWGMPMTQKQKPELVTSGPYAYIRHPIYSGILLAFIGCTLASNLFWLLPFALAGAYFIYSSFKEEEFMLKQFPSIYPKYKNKTKMLVPFLF